ncbi:hypothetical protein NVP2275O_026 [Vibrio phage 2.275.O._10N.286.54.E11]|nr:hypothetical protein NVP2275O_026 [Vibrio phage 2.275.O._10N.286.54.E11]
MRYKDLCEGSMGPSSQISEMVKLVLITMTANGVTELDPVELAQQIKQKFHIDVSSAVLIDVANDLPIVQSADENTIILGNESEMPADEGQEESSKDKVADMAQDTGSQTPGIDTWTTT